MNGTCRLCMFWKSIGTGYGECRRFPPQILGTGIGIGSTHGYFPLINGGDVCGEFKKKDEK